MASTFEKKKVSNRNYIHDDIAISILSKLPIKSLSRFSCVRKSWSLLFQNPNFFNMFRNNFLSTSHSLYDDNSCLALIHLAFVNPYNDWSLSLLSADNLLEDDCVKFDLPPPFGGHGEICVTILGSAIDGIFCLYDYDDHHNVVLWNPATQEVTEIPPSLAEFSPEFETKSTLNGFGYDYVTDDYQVIQHVDYSPFKQSPCNDVLPDPFWEIYSPKSNSWRKLDFDMPNRDWRLGVEVYLNGVCHWLTKTDNKKYLVSFNMCNETCFITPLPLELNDGFDIHLTVLNGFVAMISNYQDTMSFQISILGELGLKESWFRLLDFGPLSSIEYPMGVGKNDNIVFKKENGELACFDLTTGMIEKIGDIQDYWCHMVIYKENFHPIGGINN